MAASRRLVGAGSRQSKVKAIAVSCIVFVTLLGVTGGCGSDGDPAATPAQSPSSATSSSPGGLERSSTSSASPSARPGPVVKITSPQDQQMVDGPPIIVEGTSTGLAASSGSELWVVVFPAGTGRFHPQNPSAILTSDGTWTAPNVVLGGPDNHGVSFVIFAVVATDAASAAFRAYFEENTTSFPGLVQLPEGTTVAHRVTVTRR